jgi:Glycosyl transferase family 2
MSIAGIMLVRDEDDIIAINLRHHLPLVDHLFVIDNGSSDGTPRVLRNFARRFPQLRWTTDTGPYHQSKLLTQLAHDAWKAGAEWVFSIDADEFWRTTSDQSLRAVLEDLPSDVGALQVPVTHYVQARWVEKRHRRDLLTMTRRAPALVGPPEVADQLVAQRHTSYVEAAYAPKLISRASDQLSIGLGNHSADGLVGPVVPADSVVCLHVPLRSFANLVHRSATGDRVENEEFVHGTAWQARRWAGLSAEELAIEWRANSYDVRSGALDVHGFAHPLIDDELLRDTVLRHFSLRDRAIASLAWRRHARASR